MGEFLPGDDCHVRVVDPLEGHDDELAAIRDPDHEDLRTIDYLSLGILPLVDETGAQVVESGFLIDEDRLPIRSREPDVCRNVEFVENFGAHDHLEDLPEAEERTVNHVPVPPVLGLGRKDDELLDGASDLGRFHALEPAHGVESEGRGVPLGGRDRGPGKLVFYCGVVVVPGHEYVFARVFVECPEESESDLGCSVICSGTILYVEYLSSFRDPDEAMVVLTDDHAWTV